jgi:hypothetical protein
LQADECDCKKTAQRTGLHSAVRQLLDEQLSRRPAAELRSWSAMFAFLIPPCAAEAGRRRCRVSVFVLLPICNQSHVRLQPPMSQCEVVRCSGKSTSLHLGYRRAGRVGLSDRQGRLCQANTYTIRLHAARPSPVRCYRCARRRPCSPRDERSARSARSRSLRPRVPRGLRALTAPPRSAHGGAHVMAG